MTVVRSSGTAKQWADRAAGLLDLPESITAMLNFTQRIQSADACQGNQFLAVEYGDALDHIIDGSKGPILYAGSYESIRR